MENKPSVLIQTFKEVNDKEVSDELKLQLIRSYTDLFVAHLGRQPIVQEIPGYASSSLVIFFANKDEAEAAMRKLISYVNHNQSKVAKLWRRRLNEQLLTEPTHQFIMECWVRGTPDIFIHSPITGEAFDPPLHERLKVAV